jgi:hypothetical protein
MEASQGMWSCVLKLILIQFDELGERCIQGPMREGGGKILRIFSCIYRGKDMYDVGMIQLVKHENSSQFFH